MEGFQVIDFLLADLVAVWGVPGFWGVSGEGVRVDVHDVDFDAKFSAVKNKNSNLLVKCDFVEQKKCLYSQRVHFFLLCTENISLVVI